MKLCDIVCPKITVYDEMSRVRAGKDAIMVEMMLKCLLRFLSGGSYLDIRLNAGISLAKFYACICKCMDAIQEPEDLAYKFPSTTKEVDKAAQGFEPLSSRAAMKGRVVCLVGYLVQIKVPSSSHTGNVKAYFSGHYLTYGRNVQAVCDHKFRFVYAALAATVRANDIAAFKKIQFSQMIQKLPLRRFVVGENAYICSENLLTPSSGVENDDPSKDAFNFYLSQMRICIEQTFGIMTGT